MPIKEHSGRNTKPDEISQVLGSDAYYQRYYPKGLRERCLGPGTKDLVGVSRFYPMLEPMTDPQTGDVLYEDEKKTKPRMRTPVVVDFEPSPNESKMFLEEKRKFFMEPENRAIYIPVYLGEMLTKEEFEQRFKDEEQNLIRGYREELEDSAMASVEIPMFSDATIIAEVEALALERVTALGLRGAAKLKRMAREKEIILKERLAHGMASGRRGGTAAEPPGRQLNG